MKPHLSTSASLCAALLLVLSLGMTACGSKGPLYQPQQPSEKTAAVR